MILHLGKTQEQTLILLSKQFQTWIAQSKTPVVHVAISGGNTPQPWFQTLAQGFCETILWPKIAWYWCDERCVPPDHPKSNYGLANQTLFEHVPTNPSQVYRIHGENDPILEATAYSKVLQEKLPCTQGIPKLDIAILGIGEDGHTASLFPGQTQLLYSQALVATTFHPQNLEKRITMTPRMLTNTQNLVFLVMGSNKKAILQRIFTASKPDPQLPATLLAYARPDAHWYIDSTAQS